MIEEVVPPLTSGTLVRSPIVEASTVDRGNNHLCSNGGGNDQLTVDRANYDHDDHHEGFADPFDQVSGAASRVDNDQDNDQGVLKILLPGFMLDELRFVADQEHCDISEIVVNAVDEFLADHWVRTEEI